jgi:predicted small lipoprotein YifL
MVVMDDVLSILMTAMMVVMIGDCGGSGMLSIPPPDISWSLSNLYH